MSPGGRVAPLARSTASNVALILSLALMLGGSARGQVPPQHRYFTFETEHFRVVYPPELEGFARRAAGSAEWAYRALSARFMEPPSGPIALVVGDHSDLPNASATPIPGNRVTIVATPQILSRQLNYYSHWLDVTLVHELTHIFHLDHAAGLWTAPRALFGRAPLFFPAFYQPTWVIEGLATFYESRLTGTGRVYGGYFQSLLVGAGAGDALFPVDAANGLVPEWPAGSTPYAYGGLYFHSLADEHGDDAVAAFARRGGARLPYTLDWAAKPHFGLTLSSAWGRWLDDLRASATSRADSLRRRGLTTTDPLSGFSWSVPTARHSPDGRYLAFSHDSPRDDPATVVLDAASGETLAVHRRNTAGGTAWGRDGATLFIDQAEFADRYHLFRDLYEIDALEGGERRIGRHGRLQHPDVRFDGRLVAVQVGQGTDRLVLVDPKDGSVDPIAPFHPDVNWGRPRWSPEGDLLAAERWEDGRPLDIVLLDGSGRVVLEVTRDGAADMAPAWSPDGRYLLWSSGRTGVFEIYAVELDVDADRAAIAGGPWRVTRTLGGALDPEVSPDARWLVFAAQHPRGFRVERTTFDPQTWEETSSPARSFAATSSSRTPQSIQSVTPPRPYSPFPSLWPTGWLPLVVPEGDPEGWLLAATVLGTDDIRRHSYTALVGWRTGAEDLEALVGYSYRGLGDPILGLALAQRWDGAFALTEAGDAIPLTERERSARLAATFLRPRVRSVLSVTPSLSIERFRFFAPAGFTLDDPTFTDLEAGLRIGLSTARTRPRSLSPGAGFLAVADLDHERQADDLDRWRLTGEVELRGYGSFPVFGFADHVLAARLALGASEGAGRFPELFDVGGVPGRAFELGAGVAIGGGERYSVRGYGEAAQVGDRAASASLEYRFPLALVGRGHGLWPLLLEDLSAAFFVDAGSGWRTSGAMRVLASAGAELSSDWGLGYSFLYRFRAGLARRLVTARRQDTGWELYLGAGLAF